MHLKAFLHRSFVFFCTFVFVNCPEFRTLLLDTLQITSSPPLPTFHRANCDVTEVKHHSEQWGGGWALYPGEGRNMRDTFACCTPSLSAYYPLSDVCCVLDKILHPLRYLLYSRSIIIIKQTRPWKSAGLIMQTTTLSSRLLYLLL